MLILYILLEVNFIAPPQNTTVIKGSSVDISCGHLIATARLVTWIINGTSLNQEQIFINPLYQLVRQTTPPENSLRVFAIYYTTTFQCVVHSEPTATISTLGTVTATGMLIIMYMYVHWVSL